MFFFDIDFDIPKIEIPEINIPFDISADPGFSPETTKFTAGQTIYVRVTNPNTSPAETHILVLHDSNYNTLQTYTLNQNGNTYSTSLQAPGQSGSYSLEVRLVVNGSVNSFVRTIQVGEGGSSSNVTINQVNNSNSSSYSSSSSNSSPTPTPSPQETPQKSPQNSQVLGTAENNIFVRIFLAIANFWDNFWH